MKIFFSLGFVCLLNLIVYGQDGALVRPEEGYYHLHKFQQEIGKETFNFSNKEEQVILESEFSFTDRGSPVESSTRYVCDLSGQPREFSIKGKTSRFSTIDLKLKVYENKVEVIESDTVLTIEKPEHYFINAGYSPVIMQGLLINRWEKLGRPEKIKVVPAGTIEIRHKGSDTLVIEGEVQVLERFTLGGLIWGLETLWMNGTKLIAVISNDAEGDKFEAVLHGFEDHLPFFIRQAAADGMENLYDLSTELGPSTNRSLLIRGGTLINIQDGSKKDDVEIWIEDGKIKAINERGRIPAPKAAEILELDGAYLLPGLWDMHAHYQQVEWGPAYLAAGVTTVRDCGNEFDFITTVHNSIESGKGLGPEILMAGIVDGNSENALGIIRATNSEEAEAVVERYRKAGFDQIKVYSSIQLDVLEALCDAAHKAGMTVTGHIPSGLSTKEALLAGLDQINHLGYVFRLLVPEEKHKDISAFMDTILELQFESANPGLILLKEHGIVVDPTITTVELFTHSKSEPYQNIEPAFLKAPVALRVPLDNMGVPPERAEAVKPMFEKMKTLINWLHDEGVSIVAGTDMLVPGHSLHRELELYVEAGLTPLEALQSATIVPARVMGLEEKLGTADVGKEADLIILKANPLERIRNIRQISYVINNGRLMPVDKLWEMVDFKP